MLLQEEVRLKRNAYMREWNQRPENRVKNIARCEKYRKANLAKRRVYLYNLRKDNTVQFLLYAAKRRAKRKGILFNIADTDVYLPKVCPVLGIELKFGTRAIRDTSPTLDRIDNKKGYITGNVAIISWRANTIKSSGSAWEHRAIAAYIESYVPESETRGAKS